MAAQASVAPAERSADLSSFVQQLQRETLWLALAGTGLVSLVVLGTTGLFDEPGLALAVGMGLLLILLAVGLLCRRSYPVAAALLVVGTWGALLTVMARGNLSQAAFLLVLPVGLATLMINRPAGLVAAVAATALVGLAPPPLVPAGLGARVVAAVTIWSTVGMIWLTLRPLLSAVRWAWSGYERSLALLEQARDYQAQLQQALDDLTDANAQLIRLNRQAEALRQAAEEERRAKEQFVANVSHELRTPLNMIIGFCEMIMQAPETYGEHIPPTLLADLDVVLRNSQHLSGLIDDVLDLSQLEARQMALTRERVSLAEIVQAAAVAVRPLFESKRLTLTIDVPQGLPLVYCDCTRIREVVLNLLSNAGRFTERGGVEVRVWQEGREIVVAVADTGPGIAEGERERLFRPFQQLDSTLRRRFGGTGLGLAISKQFVELHGGRMWLESELGRGTTVYFRLPIDPPVSPAGGAGGRLIAGWEYLQRVRPSRAAPPEVPPRLVVVESGDALQRLLSRYLDGTELVAVPDLEAALRELPRLPARALLINDPAPEETLRHLGNAPLPYGVPAIVCWVPGVEQAVGALGVFDYLVKPIRRAALLEALKRLGDHVETVLVVDDEADARQLFRRMLSGDGRPDGARRYRVLRAANAKQAFELLDRERVDAILLDLVMPEMDGFQVLAALRADARLREIPVIVVSARDPLGQPVASPTLAVTSRGGLSAAELLASIEALSAILSKAAPPAGPAPTGTPRG
jgi:signal transduction histidine kinase/CheY-like chemotaxis protein